MSIKKGHWFCSLTGQKSCCLSSSQDMNKLTWTGAPRFYQDAFRAWKRQTRFVWQLHNLSALVWEISCRCPTDVPTSNLSSAPDLSLILGQHWTALDSVVDGPSSVPTITTWTNKNTAVTNVPWKMSCKFLEKGRFPRLRICGYRCKSAEC